MFFPPIAAPAIPPGSVSFNDPPVDAAVIITVAVLRGDKIKFDTVDIAAHGVEKRIESAIGFEKLSVVRC
jgi:hypothetical protein